MKETATFRIPSRRSGWSWLREGCVKAEGSWLVVGWVVCCFSSGSPREKTSSGPARPAAESAAAAAGAAGSLPKNVKNKN